jgi:hypothetical protein
VRIEGRLFLFGFIFFVLTAAGYWYFTQGEPVGTIGLALTGGLSFLVAFYVLYTARRVYPRPEDRNDAAIEEADPEYGFYSPHSWWPLVVGFACFVMVLGLVFAVWVVVLGTGILMVALVGWLFEYYRGNFAH